MPPIRGSGYPALLSTFLVFVAFACFGRAQTPDIETTRGAAPPSDSWPLADVAVATSPRITQGRLENGFTYAILPHASPPGRIVLRLFVRAGSLHENDDERGFAHFVEHMAFNGTKNFPAGELLKILQRQGAAFGPHVNADTSHTRTLYKLELPENSAAALDTGLRVFRDFADGLLFQPDEVKRERGVLLSEERTRRTPQLAETIARISFGFDGTRIPARLPLANAAEVERSAPAGLRGFYDAWYRPERMGLVVVGDIDAAVAADAIQTLFASLTARGAPRPEPDLGQPTPLAQPVVTAHARPYAGFDLHFIHVLPRPRPPSTWGNQLLGMQAHCAFSMLKRRLERISREPGAFINDSVARSRPEYGAFRYSVGGVSCAPDNWEKSLALLERELRRAVEFGFHADEVEFQKDQLRRDTRAAAQGVATTPSAAFAEALVDGFEHDTPTPFTDENLDAALQAIDRIDAAGCQRRLQAALGAQPPRIYLSAAAQFLPPPAKVAAAYAASRRVAVTAPDRVAAVTFAYENAGAPGEIVEDQSIADLDLRLLRFANGVRLNLKRTPFERGNIRFLVRLGEGRLLEPKDQPGLGLWSMALWFGGTGRHTADDFQRMLGGLRGISISSEDDALMMRGAFPGENLPLGLRQLTALVADPAFRPDAWDETKSALRGAIEPMWTRPDGAIKQLILPRLAGGDKRISIPGTAALMERTPEQLRAWLAPQTASGPLEISLVGDFEIDDAVAQIAATFGALPVREPRRHDPALTQLHFPKKPLNGHFYYGGKNERPSTLQFYWPVREAVTLSERRRLSLVAEILEGRINEQIREKKSATYSPHAEFSWNATYPGFAFLQCTVDVKPDEAKKYAGAIRDLAAALAGKGATADELGRAKAQALAAARGNRTDNRHWIEAILADVQQRPFRLDQARTAETDLAAVTLAEVNALARRYLAAERANIFTLDPDARMPKKK